MPNTPELDPWRVICNELFNLSHYEIPHIIDKTGLVVNWHLAQPEDVSENTRKKTYRPRINAAYDALNKNAKLRVAHITSYELNKYGRAEALGVNLKSIGWSMKNGQLVPATADVSELFFPDGTQHDAYIENKKTAPKSNHFS